MSIPAAMRISLELRDTVINTVQLLTKDNNFYIGYIILFQMTVFFSCPNTCIHVIKGMGMYVVDIA